MKNQKNLIQLSKIILVGMLAIYFTIVVLGNITDYGTNYQFVEHVLAMDTTFNSPNLMYRAINSEPFYHVFYWIIILTEILIAALLGLGTIMLFNKNKKKAERGKNIAIKGLILSMILWLGCFITIGGEWFAMWQSSTWNGLDPAFRMFVISGITFLVMIHKD